MKKQMLAVLVGTVMAMPMMASAQTSYFGINGGKAKQKLTIDGFGSADDDFSSYKIYAGYNFNTNFGIEGGYAHLGTLRGSITDGVDTVSAKVKARSFYVAATGTLPLNEQFSLFAKAGVSFNRLKASVTENGVFQGSDSANRTTPLIGVGAAFNLNKSWSIVAEYENYGKTYKEDDAHVKTTGWSIGARYSF